MILLKCANADRKVRVRALIEKANPAWIDLGEVWCDVEPADLRRATDPMLT